MEFLSCDVLSAVCVVKELIYEDRPLGCLLYPVVYSIDEGVMKMNMK